MKRAIPLLLLTLAGCTQPAAPGGGGIVSTNPCADAMLVALVPPSRIAAISHYSVEAEASSMPLAIARRFATTTGTAEEVIGLRPDLVVTSSFTPPATLVAVVCDMLQDVLLRELGAPLDHHRPGWTGCPASPPP